MVDEKVKKSKGMKEVVRKRKSFIMLMLVLLYQMKKVKNSTKDLDLI